MYEVITMTKMVMLVKSGNYTDFMTATMIASGAIANDMEVEIFFMNDAVWALKKENYMNNTTVHSNFLEFAHTIADSLNEGKIKPWWELMADLKEFGDIKLTVCALVAELGNLHKEDFMDLIDDLAGVAYFTGQAEDADVVLTI